ncbi:MAG: PAS domain S-box protein [Deltaproteobacteria bacterium]|nr:PAS domain S-box protein [Deltaproteobacteria bacterium]
MRKAKTNETMVELFRCNRPLDLVGKLVQEFFLSEEDYRRTEEIVSAGLCKGRSYGADLKLKRFDGTVFDAHLKVAPFESKGRGEMFVATISDVSWRKEIERALTREKERLAVTLTSIGDGVISTDRSGAIALVNKTAEELTGWEEGEAVGKFLDEVFYVINEETGEPYGNLVKKVLQERAILNLPAGTLLISKDKQRRPIEGSLSPIYLNQSEIVGSVIVFRDLSERRTLEEEVMRMQKLEAIGVMAGGIAHDFNNLLMGIVGYITLARMNLEHRDKILENLKKAENACMRAKELAQKLIVFSKGGEPIRETVSMAKLLKDSISLCMSGSNVKAEFSLPEGLWQVHVDEGQIAQVIHNIVQNALESMGEGGAIFVKGENVQIPPGESMPIDPGPYVKITIQDHGPGIPSEHMANIFDPFYTTKEMGRGLGLSVCHSIVKKHGGHIQVHSRPGCGTEVSVYLPALEAGETRHVHESFSPSSRGIRVLLMDDEEIVRETTRQMLVHFGCDVDCAAEGGEAIDLYKKAKESGRPYDVVILDLTVPGGMGGKETAVDLLKVDPEAKMIVSSGYANDPVMSQFRQYGFKAAIAKPYNMDELIEVMRDLTSGDSR